MELRDRVKLVMDELWYSRAIVGDPERIKAMIYCDPTATVLWLTENYKKEN